MENLIAAILIILLVGGASYYIRREKKKGVRCIGCPNAGKCPRSCGCGSLNT